MFRLHLKNRLYLLVLLDIYSYVTPVRYAAGERLTEFNLSPIWRKVISTYGGG
jgi:hypothetical protein